MRSESGKTTSLWAATAQRTTRPALDQKAEADVCVVGAGISGLTVAYLLGREGKSVIVLDDKAIGGGMTERTSAHLASAIDDRFSEIERMHGEKGSRLAAESHSAAIDRIESIVNQEKIDCDFARVDGYLFVPPGESHDILEKELEAARRAGLEETAMVKRAPLGSFDTGPCLRFPRQAQFHPLKYLEGLARAIERDGGRIYSHSHVKTVDGQSGPRVRTRTERGHEVEAGAAVVATNTPINDMYAIHTKQAPYISYVIAVKIPRDSVTRALYWDTPDPYHYVRVETPASPDEDELLIVGGEDHKTGQADDIEERYARLEAWTRERFKMARDVVYRWSGQVMEPADGIAFIGRNPSDSPNVYIATGDSGMGLTHGTIAGILITDLIMGRENPWTALYEPSRKTLSAPLEFVKENLNVAAQMVKDYVRGGDVKSTDDLKPGQGAVLRHGLSKMAVYRDDAGVLHKRSAVCRHLGCIVHWNGSEKTWDCPCHGARYNAYGEVINGPAISDLEPIKD